MKMWAGIELAPSLPVKKAVERYKRSRPSLYMGIMGLAATRHIQCLAHSMISQLTP
jgi:hypothetical protein